MAPPWALVGRALVGPPWALGCRALMGLCYNKVALVGKISR